MVGPWRFELQTSTVSRPSYQYFEQLTRRRRPPKYVEMHIRRSFNGTESGTGFLRRCFRFLVNPGKDVKTIQGLLRHANVTTTLDLYSQAIDAAKLEAQEEIALAITSTAVAVD